MILVLLKQTAIKAILEIHDCTGESKNKACGYVIVHRYCSLIKQKELYNQHK